jgi:hypothetical protein
MSNVHSLAAANSNPMSGPKRRGVIVAGRWAGAETIIRNAAWRMGCDIRFEIERGWVVNTYRFEIYGGDADKAIIEIANAIERARTK